MLVLALESSTSAAKALLYDTEKGVLDCRQQNYPEKYNRGGRTDTDEVFKITMEMGRMIAEGKMIDAIALCGTWHSLAVCDKDFAPVTGTYSWNYLGAAEMCEKIRESEEKTAFFYERTGCMPHSTYPRHAMAMLREKGLDLSDKKIMTQGAYNFYKITGNFWETACSQSGSGLICLETKCYDEKMLEYIGIRKDQLGELVTYRNDGYLNEYGAKLLGLQTGIPVIPTHADGALNQVGSFAQRTGAMTLSIGTSAALRFTTACPKLPKGRQLWCYSGVENWIVGAAIAGACNCINWFKDGIASGEKSFEQLESAEWNRDCPTFLPFLYGERCPGWHDERRGGFADIKPQHGLEDMYRAVQMGILFNLYQCYEILVSEYEEPMEIIVSGGIVNSKKWSQMLADIFRKEIIIANQPNASSMGAVALALYSVGYLKDVRDFREDYDKAVTVKPISDRFFYYSNKYKKYLEFYGK